MKHKHNRMQKRGDNLLFYTLRWHPELRGSSGESSPLLALPNGTSGLTGPLHPRQFGYELRRVACNRRQQQGFRIL
ncbi:hypothetical protein NDU88_003589 [Pleurodeles waltl]|uniref:Uncharacterized protein n=1 Tax=Pleurodeles waltl TaxID=8319 RepID=A0AAV7KVW2_PLEWA|nr:hypothetical protein NDU88_003589 [Pleurodeles waltl]